MEGPTYVALSAQVLAQAAVTQGVASLYAVDTAALGIATEKDTGKQ